MNGQPGPPTKCRSCKAPIRWTQTPNGKLMPLEVDPDPTGNVTIDDQRIAHVDPDGQGALFDEPGQERWRPHWASCPQAETWRRSA